MQLLCIAAGFDFLGVLLISLSSEMPYKSIEFSTFHSYFKINIISFFHQLVSIKILAAGSVISHHTVHLGKIFLPFSTCYLIDNNTNPTHL